jgi:uncharacterized membrane protein YhdT
MAVSETRQDDAAWGYSFAILLLASLAMLALRLLGRAFLALEFEIALIYFPTLLSGVIAAYMIRQGAK